MGEYGKCCMSYTLQYDDPIRRRRDETKFSPTKELMVTILMCKLLHYYVNSQHSHTLSHTVFDSYFVFSHRTSGSLQSQINFS
jgi:hypothetical protein